MRLAVKEQNENEQCDSDPKNRRWLVCLRAAKKEKRQKKIDDEETKKRRKDLEINCGKA